MFYLFIHLFIYLFIIGGWDAGVITRTTLVSEVISEALEGIFFFFFTGEVSFVEHDAYLTSNCFGWGMDDDWNSSRLSREAANILR